MNRLHQQVQHNPIGAIGAGVQYNVNETNDRKALNTSLTTLTPEKQRTTPGTIKKRTPRRAQQRSNTNQAPPISMAVPSSLGQQKTNIMHPLNQVNKLFEKYSVYLIHFYVSRIALKCQCLRLS